MYIHIYSLFDNTWGTYLTDYIIAAATTCGAIHLLNTSSSRFAKYSFLMQLLYALSVLTGGLSHHFVHGAHLNTRYFRLIWTVTVLAVVLAGAAQGMIGSEVILILDKCGEMPV